MMRCVVLMRVAFVVLILMSLDDRLSVRRQIDGQVFMRWMGWLVLACPVLRIVWRVLNARIGIPVVWIAMTRIAMIYGCMIGRSVVG